MIDSQPVRALRAALYRRMERPEHGDQDLQGWRNRLLNGLCAVAFWLGLMAFVPSMWAGLRQGRLPMVATDARVEGILTVGERASGVPFSGEDRQVALTLARQAQAALENARLQRVREAKQRQDRELQIAREIQTGLFPSGPPELSGFEVAGESKLFE